MDIPKISHRLRYTRTSQSEHHFRADYRTLTNELRSWPLEGKLFRSTPAHIFAANPTIRKDLVEWLYPRRVETAVVENLENFLE